MPHHYVGRNDGSAPRVLIGIANSEDTIDEPSRQAQAPDRKASIVQQVEAARASILEQYPNWPEDMRTIGVGALFITEPRSQIIWSLE